MLAYIGRRALLAVFTVWAISVLSFAIIQLPPGDYVTSYIAQMASMGVRIAKNTMGNVPQRQYNSPDGKTPTISRPVTFYWKK